MFAVIVSKLLNTPRSINKSWQRGGHEVAQRLRHCIGSAYTADRRIVEPLLLIILASAHHRLDAVCREHTKPGGMNQIHSTHDDIVARKKIVRNNTELKVRKLQTMSSQTLRVQNSV